MKVYVINLDRAADRWSRVAAAMDETGLRYERFAAIDGRTLTLPVEQFSVLRYRLYHGKRPNYGQIGCFLSHIAVMKRFLAGDDKFAMICEDDIAPAADLGTILQAAMQYQPLWDVLRLSGFHDAHPMPFVSIGQKHTLAVNLTRLCGTGCYVLSRHAAKVLLDRLLPMRVPIDHAIDREWFYGIKTLVIDPLPVKQNLPEIASSLPAGEREKLPGWQRYWTVFPYRTLNESCRAAMRSKQYIQCCRAIARSQRHASAVCRANLALSRAA